MAINEKKYVMKINGNYYAGPNKKYADMYDISGSGAIGALQMDYETAEKKKKIYEKYNDVTIEEYDPRVYIKEIFESILDEDRRIREGKTEPGYYIHNVAEKGLAYIAQL